MANIDMLKTGSEVPKALYDCTAADLNQLLGGPSLLYVKGLREPALFVTVLQHGNEPTGFEAIQQILRKYRDKPLPRSLWLFISNVSAAEKGLRVLPGQTDYNRVWPGTELPASPETDLMAEVVRRVTEKPLFASVDLHNNTGCNPHYGCVNRLDAQSMHLAALFSRTVVYFTRPVGVQSLAMSQYTPSVTLECGQAGENAALEHAVGYLDACLHLHHLPEQAIAKHDIHLLHTVATVKVLPGTDFGFGEVGRDVNFLADLDHYNFGIIAKGKSIAKLQSGAGFPLVARDLADKDVSRTLFECRGEDLVVRQDLIPSMATLNCDVVRQDCLFYVMEEIALS